VGPDLQSCWRGGEKKTKKGQGLNPLNPNMGLGVQTGHGGIKNRDKPFRGQGGRCIRSWEGGVGILHEGPLRAGSWFFGTWGPATYRSKADDSAGGFGGGTILGGFGAEQGQPRGGGREDRANRTNYVGGPEIFPVQVFSGGNLPGQYPGRGGPCYGPPTRGTAGGTLKVGSGTSSFVGREWARFDFCHRNP